MAHSDTRDDVDVDQDDPIDSPLCYWCDRLLVDVDHFPYCSPLCAAYAERDSVEDDDDGDL